MPVELKRPQPCIAPQPVAQRDSRHALEKDYRPIQLPRFARQQQSEAEEIAERIRVGPRLDRLEKLLNRQSVSPFELLGDHHAPRRLEYLAIARQVEGGYGIAVRSRGWLLTSILFETVHHCTEAALELERTFAIEQYVDMPSSEAVERVAEIVQYHCWREKVELRLTA